MIEEILLSVVNHLAIYCGVVMCLGSIMLIYETITGEAIYFEGFRPRRITDDVVDDLF